jgi:hypothetical protein
MEWRMYSDVDGAKEDFRRYIKTSMATSMGHLILDEKPDAFTESFDFDVGQRFDGEAIVFSPKEWREFQNKLAEIITNTRYKF